MTLGKDTTNNNFENNSSYLGSIQIHLLLAIGLIVLAVCVLMWLFARTSNSLTSLQRCRIFQVLRSILDKDFHYLSHTNPEKISAVSP